MSKNDHMVRCDPESYNLLKMKKEKMEKVAFSLTNKPVKIPFKRIIKMLAKKPIYLDDNNLLEVAKVKKKRKWY